MRNILLLLLILACAGCAAVDPVETGAMENNCNIYISQHSLREHDRFRKIPEDETPFFEPAQRILAAKGYTLVDDCKLASMEIYAVPLQMSHGYPHSRLTISRIRYCEEFSAEDFLFEARYRYDGFRFWLDNAFKDIFERLDKEFPTCEAQTFKPPEKPWF